MVVGSTGPFRTLVPWRLESSSRVERRLESSSRGAELEFAESSIRQRGGLLEGCTGDMKVTRAVYLGLSVLTGIV